MAETCPCGSGDDYAACCKPIHKDPSAALTAEALMRARYTAFVRAEIKFLEESLAPKARKDFKEHEMRRWAKESDWKGLEIVSTSEGGAKDARGEVEFIARYESDGEAMEHHERAEFRKPSDRWYYIDGRVLGGRPITREEPKVGRNDACPCGSGKKYKQCHGRTGTEAVEAAG